ncbi:proline/glycine betaine ABC transporter permease [Plantibacter sp. MMLR14_011]|uniref:ABC transporter permease n=1 Tax=Plantibacter sp. MMLR14_011 TaxID=1898746 RepID=UPI000A95C1AB|nr:ABC transporter permease subunit [Plantibacter sp. MMLR14_011]
MNGIRLQSSGFLDAMTRPEIGAWVEAFVDFITDVFQPVFDVIRSVFQGLYDGVDLVLSGPPFWVIIIVAALLAFVARGPVFAVGSAVGLLIIVGVEQWDNAMDSLSLVLVAGLIAIVIGIPLGILAARSKVASSIIRPLLDFMQTTPAFVYLIPALILFRIGVVPGIVATIVFALAPAVRLTELGIRNVDREVVEAGNAFGASSWRILRQIQLPLAMPNIMAGVNQVIMLSLSMVVIAGMVGAGGLGGDVVKSLSRIDIQLGSEAGLSVVILAIFLDRLTASLGGGRKQRGKRTKAAPASPAGIRPAPAASTTTTDSTASGEEQRTPAESPTAVR